MQLLELLVSFLIIGVGAYGGGTVTIPLIEREIVVRHGWLDGEGFAEVVALAQMTPGPIAVNAATFTGYRVAGVTGAAVATVGVVTPSLVIMCCLVFLLHQTRGGEWAGRLRRWVKPGVLALITLAVWSISRAAIVSWHGWVIAAASLGILLLLEGKVHPVVVVIGFGLVGIFLF